MLTVAVLDVVEVRREGVRTPVRPGKTSEVLVALALEAGTLVRTERLIGDLWADAAAGTARNTLQTKVSRLRRALGDPALVSGTSTGYTLHVDTTAVDALEVVRLAGEAAAFRTAGDAASALRTCTDALALFGGEPLLGAGEGEWLLPHRGRLEEVRTGLVEGRLAALLELGAAAEVVPELEALVRQHPVAEGLWALLVIGLYRAGRQADALAAYRRVSRILDHELGVAPGPALQALERRVLLQDPTLDLAPLRTRTAGRRRGNVPELAAAMVGRDSDLAEARRLVGRHRLTTVVGPAGVGKTRLAVEVARQAEPDGGAWLVRLESARDPSSVLQALAAVLDVPRATEAEVVDRLRDADALLVVDNCEHVVDAASDCVVRLLAAAPGLRVLCTSQMPLAVEGEVTMLLEPLRLEDSVELFRRLAAAQRRSFDVDGDTEATLAQVCRSLDGLPLAIELAAARARTLSVGEIARRLQDRFALLTDPTSRRPERQRALGAAIGWSYDLLLPDDQRGLWALACFADGAGLPAVERVLAALGVPAAAALDVVTRLAARSLVEVAPDGAGVRYRLLDSIRAFAGTRLEEAGQAEVGQRAHAGWFAEAADRAVEGARGPDQLQHLDLARTERADLDAALAWATRHDPATALRIAVGFGWSWFLLGERPAGAGRLRRALAAADPVGGGGVGGREEVVRALCLLAWLEPNDLDTAHADGQRALDTALALGDDRLVAISRAALAFVLLQQAQPHEALRLLEPCPAVHAENADAWEEGAAWILTVHAALVVGNLALAARACQVAQGLLRDLGDAWAFGHLEGALGFLAQSERRFPEAVDHLRKAAQAAGSLRFRATQALHLATLGRILHQSGDPSGAVVALQDAVEIGLAIRDLRVVALGRVRLGRVLRTQGHSEAAAAAVHAADHWFRSSGGGEGAALAACLAATLDAAAGTAGAVARLDSVLKDARDHREVDVEVLALDALARARATAGDLPSAQEALAAADVLFPSVQHLLGEDERLDAEQARRLLAPAAG